MWAASAEMPKLHLPKQLFCSFAKMLSLQFYPTIRYSHYEINSAAKNSINFNHLYTYADPVVRDPPSSGISANKVYVTSTTHTYQAPSTDVNCFGVL